MAHIEKATECAACGRPIKIGVGHDGDFCSTDCLRAGRASCKFCDRSLNQPVKGPKKTYCDDLCGERYRRMGYLSPLLREEWGRERKRSTCKCGCGKRITQPKRGRRLFYNRSCKESFHRKVNLEQNLIQEWGAFRPETRKCLQQLQESQGVAAARRMATAINHEYTSRVTIHPNKTKIICHCKTCGKEFSRLSWSHASRDYCTPRHNLSKKRRAILGGERGPGAKLTWEQVDEIRRLYATGGITYLELGERYGVSAGNICEIILTHTWNPEDDPRRKQMVEQQNQL